MSLAGKTVLLTGASSGIGRCTALELAGAGARLALVGRDEKRLNEVCDAAKALGTEALPFVQDLTELDELNTLCRSIIERMTSVDVLINNAGTLEFTPVERQSPAALEHLYRTNVIAPLAMCRELLMHFRQRGQGQIVNVGSIFGSIGFAYFAAYSSTKFALRGYSEALRRELAGSGISVTYLAPRATRTRLAALFGAMAGAVGMKLDEPEKVARRVVRSIEAPAGDYYLGFPESLFVRINAVLPRLVDVALRKQTQQMRPFAEEASGQVGGQQ